MLNIKYSFKEVNYLLNTILSTINLMQKKSMPKNSSSGVNENKGIVLTSCSSSAKEKNV